MALFGFGKLRTCSIAYLPQWRIQKFRMGGSAAGARSAPANFWVATPTSVTLAVRTEYLEATLGLVKCLEISKELIRECVTMPGCCCCMPLLHNHLMDSCSYVRKNTLLAAKGGCICTPLTPPESATVPSHALQADLLTLILYQNM